MKKDEITLKNLRVNFYKDFLLTMSRNGSGCLFWLLVNVHFFSCLLRACDPPDPGKFYFFLFLLYSARDHYPVIESRIIFLATCTALKTPIQITHFTLVNVGQLEVVCVIFTANKFRPVYVQKSKK